MQQGIVERIGVVKVLHRPLCQGQISQVFVVGVVLEERDARGAGTAAGFPWQLWSCPSRCRRPRR